MSGIKTVTYEHECVCGSVLLLTVDAGACAKFLNGIVNVRCSKCKLETKICLGLGE